MHVPGLRAVVVVALTFVLLQAGGPGDAEAQGRGRAGGPPAGGARAAAPRDFTGTWVSVVTEHWHLRMLMPPRGEYTMLPLTPAARKIADAWDPAKDRAEGNECRSYGAAAIMRVPSRIHLQWTDENTLQMEIDSGTQTRQFRFGAGAPPTGAPATWQGYSVANWEGTGGRAAAPPNGRLRVVTTHMRPGLLRKNGVPYSESARLEEHFETFAEPNGDRWLVVTAIVTDPQYLAQPYATTYPFKKIPDRAGWDPTPCRVDEPR